MDGIIDTVDMSMTNLWEIVKNREACHAVVHEVEESDTTEQQQQQLSILWPLTMLRFPHDKQFSKSLYTTTECPTIQLNSDTA